jgi:nucleoside-diphosphate-sugar epimerase
MILVVGGAGYLGSCVVDELVARDETDFRVYDNLLYQDEYRLDVPFVHGDVTDRDKMMDQFNDADIVIWLAALVGDGVCMLDPARARAVNQDAVEFLSRNFRGTIFYASTCSVYGATKEVADEHHLVDPQSIYAETKLVAESYLLGADKDAVILRLGTLHGVSRRMRFDLVVNAMTRDAYHKGHVNVFGGSQIRPLLSVKDAARTIVDLALTNRWVSGIFNLASANLEIGDIGECVGRLTNAQVNVIPMESEDRRDYAVDSSMATHWFGFEPQFTVADSVSDVENLLLSGRLKDPFNSRYRNQEAYRCQVRHQVSSGVV